MINTMRGIYVKSMFLSKQKIEKLKFTRMTFLMNGNRLSKRVLVLWSNLKGHVLKLLGWLISFLWRKAQSPNI